MLDVIFLSFNHSHVVGDSLKSVIHASEGLAANIFIVDDCSTDDSILVIESVLAELDVISNVRLIKNQNNLGMAASFDIGCSCSSADFIAVCHHDDVYKKEFFLRPFSVQDGSAKPISFWFHNYGNGFDWSRFFDHDGLMGGLEFFKRFLIGKLNCPVRGSAIISRSAYLKVGGIRLEYGLLADVDLWMRLARLKGCYVGYQKEISVALGEARPDNYPDEYKATVFSVKRLLILYKIHLDNSTGFDSILSHGVVFMDVAKWALYFIARGRKKIKIELALSGLSLDDRISLRIYYRVFGLLA